MVVQIAAPQEKQDRLLRDLRHAKSGKRANIRVNADDNREELIKRHSKALLLVQTLQ